MPSRSKSKKSSTDLLELYRKLPAVDEIVRMPEVMELVRQDGTGAGTDAARLVVNRLRSEIASGRLDSRGLELALGNLSEAVKKQLERLLEPSLRSVINATGVILHTNLGRAPLADAVVERIRETATGYSNLEFDVESGER
ncbi:MAG TPA: hypothetical protein VM056_04330, partial [Terriglobales bacterium]|nr:hypothetical protein [Terriglobales bacterium]